MALYFSCIFSLSGFSIAIYNVGYQTIVILINMFNLKSHNPCIRPMCVVLLDELVFFLASFLINSPNSLCMNDYLIIQLVMILNHFKHTGFV
jgi:hypothetical protein